MQYVYEILIDEIGKKNAEKVFSYLRNLKIDVIKTEEKLIIKSEDFYFLDRLDKMLRALKVGFDFKQSKKIIESDYELLEIDVKRAVDKKINHLKRIIGRIVGKDGKSIDKLKKLSKSDIIVTDRYVYILGDKLSVEAAYEGIKLLVQGSPHKRAYERVVGARRHLKYKEKEVQLFFDDYNL